MKIYRFFDGKLYDLEVRETPNGSVHDSEVACCFDFCRAFHSSEFTSAGAAISAEIEKKYEELKPLRAETLKIKAEIKKLHEMQKDCENDSEEEV